MQLLAMNNEKICGAILGNRKLLHIALQKRNLPGVIKTVLHDAIKQKIELVFPPRKGIMQTVIRDFRDGLDELFDQPETGGLSEHRSLIYRPDGHDSSKYIRAATLA